MPTTRKKVIKTVYKDEDDSEAEDAVGDFSDSGSEAEIPEQSSSDEDLEAVQSSADEFDEKSKKKLPQTKRVRKHFAKEFISKINRQSSAGDEVDDTPVLFSVKDLTDEDKLLPSVLNLSESDSSEDESSKPAKKKVPVQPKLLQKDQSDSDTEAKIGYQDVWSQNIQDDSEEVAKKTFMELEQHKNKIEETKASILNYTGSKLVQDGESKDVQDLLALGEEVLSPSNLAPVKKGRKTKKARDDSDSEMEDWEEVKDAKLIPQQGIQLVVDFPDSAYRKSKKLDVEMMMKRKINRVKKEYQAYMHKVHVLCWLGHGNYVSRVLNDQEILAAALSLVPSKECYPGERVDMKYVEQVTTWYKDKLTLKQDKNEEKFRPKAPPLKDVLLKQIKSRVVTTKKYLVFIFVSMLRALGLQCRVMFNFVTLPLKPPTSELCSLSTKPKDEKKVVKDKEPLKSSEKCQNKSKKNNSSKSKVTIPQMDGNFDTFSSDDSDIDTIMQLDGNDDVINAKTRRTRVNKNEKSDKDENEDVSPPKRARKTPSLKPLKSASKTEKDVHTEKDAIQKRTRACRRTPVELGSIEKKETKGNMKTAKEKSVTEQTSNVDIVNVDVPEDNNKLPSPRKARRVNKGTNKIETDKTKTELDQKVKKMNPPKMSVINRSKSNMSQKKKTTAYPKVDMMDIDLPENIKQPLTANKSTSVIKSETTKTEPNQEVKKSNLPKITVTNENNETSSRYFDIDKPVSSKNLSLRKRSQTSNPTVKNDDKTSKTKSRTRSAPGTRSPVETSQYFGPSENKSKISRSTKKEALEDKQRVSHRDLAAKNKVKPKNDVTGDLVDIIKKRVKEAKEDTKKRIVKGKKMQESDEDSDHLPVESSKRRKSDSDDDFKPTKISPKPSTSRISAVKKIDRRVLSSDSEDMPLHKCNVWCEVFVEELEQWIAVDVIRAKAHCPNEIYSHATHPVCYVVGWDNNNYLKDLTRRYVPQWNTVTRKLRAEPAWLATALRPWLGPRTGRDKEEDEQLDMMQLEAPLPKVISEYKNHPLYALKRHLLKFEAIYPPDAATLGFVRGEAVYARECVYVCRSRDTWLKEAKVVRLGEQPYKVVKARPKWDKLSNKMITDKPLEVFGPWQVQDYEPPTAERGVVPRNAYGNVELFKLCMLPRGTVHVKLPGLNRVCKKLNIDCAPAMTGFDFSGGWSHPVYDGFVVCSEYEQTVTEAWLQDQEDQERREREKLEARVYGNWRRLVKGLLIKQRLKNKYGFEDPALPDKKSKGPRLVVKK